MTQAAIVLAVLLGSAPDDVGVSVEPKAETINAMPASLYAALVVLRSAAVREAQPWALSHAPSVSRNATMLRKHNSIEEIFPDQRQILTIHCSPAFAVR